MNQDILEAPLLPVALAAFGLVFGSFTTALTYRLPRGESIARGRSRCASCGHTLAAADLVPVFSWVAHKGACRYCRAKISARYPIIEIVSATLFVAAGVLAHDTAELLLLLAATPVMLALAVIDLEHQRLPNSLIALLALFALAWRLNTDGQILVGVATAAAAIAAGILLDVAHKSIWGVPGLGMGDTKLFAVAGLALPVGTFLMFAALAGVLGVFHSAIARARDGSWAFPFGPAILAAFWLVLPIGAALLNQALMFRAG